MMHNKTLIINDNILSYTSQRGVARYFQYIREGIIAEFGDRVIVYSSEQRDYGAAKHILAPRLAVFRGSARLGIPRFIQRIRQSHMQQWVEKLRPAMLYSPYYGVINTNIPQIFTVHDMIHELFPNYFDIRNRDVRQFVDEKRACIRNASVLIAVSECTAKDMRLLYSPIPESKLRVIHHGVSPAFFRSQHHEDIANRGEMLPRPYFLYVGNRNDYKNFKRLLNAYGQSQLSRIVDLKVISPAGSGFTPAELKIIEANQLNQHVQLQIAASENALRDCYSKALASICPSEYEGFGLPVLEAMASGTLVACSNTSSLPEVGGTVAFYFDPLNIESMAATLKQVSRLSAEERTNRIDVGVAHARTFTWERCQQQTIDAFRRFL
jgi:glycosyltransferase involved in cell wall biosynthesis